jgi:hypothetical protein
MTAPYARSSAALGLLQQFPPSIRESLGSSSHFLREYGLRSDAIVSFGFDKQSASFNRSELFNTLRTAIETPNEVSIHDITDVEWRIEKTSRGGVQQVLLRSGDKQIVLSNFVGLQNDRNARVQAFDKRAEEFNLPEDSIKGWRNILHERGLTDEEVVAAEADLRDTPVYCRSAVRQLVLENEQSISGFVPASRRYYERLVGSFKDQNSIQDYARSTARSHMHQLLSWRPTQGLLQALLLSSHPAIPIELANIEFDSNTLTQAYNWLLDKGDRYSQLGAIELGFLLLQAFPQLAEPMKALIAQIKEDDAEAGNSRFRLLSALIVLVDGELAKTRTLANQPPFWRRLAAISHAALLERELVDLAVDIETFHESAINMRGVQFYFQTLVDLRREPRWVPDYIAADQLSAEFIGRVLGSANGSAAETKLSVLSQSQLDELQTQHPLIKLYIPGPLEGSFESKIEPPEQVIEAIEEQLASEIVQPESFIALINSCLIFRTKKEYADRAADVVRSADHYIKRVKSKEQLFTVINGLAGLCAVSRSSELAQEIRVLLRRYRRGSSYILTHEDCFRLLLVAAAAYSDIEPWSEFVGDSATELALEVNRREDASRLRSDLAKVCHAERSAWVTCGRADTALACLMLL